MKIRRKIIFIGGETSSGKTALRLILTNPDISEDELLALTANRTMNVVNDRIIRDDINRRFIIDARLTDPPGGKYEEVINSFLRTEDRNIPSIAIIVLSPTRSPKNRNEIDSSYVTEQFNNVKYLWASTIKSSYSLRPKKFLVFLNKRDLYDDFETVKKEFGNHISILKKTCGEKNIPFEVICGSVVKKNGLQQIINILKEVK